MAGAAERLEVLRSSRRRSRVAALGLVLVGGCALEWTPPVSGDAYVDPGREPADAADTGLDVDSDEAADGAPDTGRDVDSDDGEGPPECTRGGNVAPSAVPASSGGGTGEWAVELVNDGGLEETCEFHWVAAGHTPGDAYLALDWPSERTFFGMWIDTNQWEETSCYLPGGATLAGGDVEWWDGEGWVTAGVVSGQPDDWSFEFEPEVTTTRLRITGVHATTLGGDTRNPIVYEWEVYECDW